ncbi:MAG: hypothetical protein NTW87_07905 [Planctomycetota bacterium]|nr:hypothetical protein [Planctomycetota bacterium]
MTTPNLDKQALSELGVQTQDVTPAELAYLKRRKAELEPIECPEPLVIQQLLAAELHIKRVWNDEQRCLNDTPENIAELQYQRQRLDELGKERAVWMARYDAAAIGLGLRRRKKADAPAPLASLWLRWRRQKGAAQ